MNCRAYILGFILGLFGLITHSYSSDPASSVPFQSMNPRDSVTCVTRDERVKPPPYSPPDPIRHGKYISIENLEGMSAFCPDGQVPFVKALNGKAKGNPLLRRIKNEKTYKILPWNEVYRKESSNSIPPFPSPTEDDAYQASSEPRPSCDGIYQYDACFYYAAASTHRLSDGAGMMMQIQKPGVVGAGHSLDEIAVQGGLNEHDIVELGWNVSSSQYNDLSTHLFVFHWLDGEPTCYDGCGWNQWSRKYFPGMVLDRMIGQEVYIGYVYYEGNWWAWFNNEWLGYFPGNEWDGNFRQNTLTQWFGEVASHNGIPPLTKMGDGFFPMNPHATKNEALCNVSFREWKCWVRDDQEIMASKREYYDILRTDFGEVKWGGPGEAIKILLPGGAIEIIKILLPSGL